MLDKIIQCALDFYVSMFSSWDQNFEQGTTQCLQYKVKAILYFSVTKFVPVLYFNILILHILFSSHGFDFFGVNVYVCVQLCMCL